MTPLGETYGPWISLGMFVAFLLIAAYLLVTKVLPETREWRKNKKQ